VKAAEFTIDNVPELILGRDDPWEQIFAAKQDLHDILGL
jgi:DNA primase